jgi:protein TonB
MQKQPASRERLSPRFSSKDGHIADLHVISGPQKLQQAALDAARTRVYKPYLLNGAPVEVNTTINVVFTLSR